MEGGRGKEKGAYLEAIVTAAKLATISLPPMHRLRGWTDGRTDGATDKLESISPQQLLSTCRLDPTTTSVRPLAASSERKENDCGFLSLLR